MKLNTKYYFKILITSIVFMMVMNGCSPKIYKDIQSSYDGSEILNNTNFNISVKAIYLSCKMTALSPEELLACSAR